MNWKILTLAAMSIIILSCCSGNKEQTENKAQPPKDDFKYLAEQVADMKLLRYKVPGFDSLSVKQKELIYYLSQAALCGRDITWDQNFKHNLCIRRTLEAIIDCYTGDKNSEDWKKFIVYTKQVWFSNGIHHHYSNDKFVPEFSKEYFVELVKNSKDARFPLEKGETVDDLVKKLTPVMFDATLFAKRVNQAQGVDMIAASASNFYEGLTQKEAENFYKKMMKKEEKEPISYGLNSKLVKGKGKISEKVYKVSGMYGAAIEKIVYWLEKAVAVSENEKQKEHLQKLIEYYKTGDLKTWDDYNIKWAKDNDSHIDYVNGFIEVYGDPLALKATWESVVNFKDIEATKRAVTISGNAQWFEDHSPVDSRFKKKEVKGVTAKVITVAQLGGDCDPSTPIGINLPNADWIRKEHGSKSVTMDNITYSYDQASIGNGFLEEFCFTKEERELQEKYGAMAGNIHTDLHECLGHGSGQMLPGVSADALKNYHSVLEEARADLFALYYMMDQKMVEIGVMPNLNVAKAEYNNYVRNGMMTQLTRVEPGKDIQQAHMRNRQLIAKWCYEKGEKEKVIEKKVKEGKTFYVVNDYNKLRVLFGDLLKEAQRIKSEGDFETGKNLVESYAVKVDPELHKEVKTRYEKLKLAPYGGFINPVFKPVMQGDKIVDVKIEYPNNFMEQMLYYSKEYSFLPTYN
ncbi:MAG: dihydrofolate reductase [Bacteroidia bacterium]|nr:dihydrofolate reductase [Bacteroidia bacterium]